MSVSVVLENVCSTVGEGPHWDAASQTLLFIDIHTGDIHKYNTVTQEHNKVKVDGTIGFVVPHKDGGYVIGQNQTLAHLDFDSGKTQVLAGVEDGLDTRFNDGKCDRSGRLWAGTMAIEKSPGVLEHNLGSLYSLDQEGQVQKRQGSVTISNGLAWSSDDRTMYYIDSFPRQVYAYDFDINTGNISNRRVCLDVSDSPREDLGFPDGMCIDQEGKLWIACFFGAKVIRIDPNTGQILRRVDIPARRVTSCSFGGPNCDELYVTCSAYGAEADEKAKYPLTGSLFKVTGLGVKGYPGVDYAGVKATGKK